MQEYLADALEHLLENVKNVILSNYFHLLSTEIGRSALKKIKKTSKKRKIMNEVIAKNCSEKDLNVYELQSNEDVYDGVSASVALSHDDDNLIVKFDVIEKQLRRMATHHNDEVYEDSCVEVFLQREGSSIYRNFELSATMYELVGEGECLEKRVRLDPKRIDEIERSITIIENTTKRVHYIIDEKINLRDWGFLNDGEKIEDLKLRCNMTKYGAKLEEPNRLTLFKMKEGYVTFHDKTSFRPIKFV
jgi:hypothetical protein